MSEVTAEGLDYSYQHPDLGCAFRSGYRFVARYIGNPRSDNGAKYLDAAELARIRAAGLAVVAVRETSAGFMLTESGADHARRSREHCNRLGMAGVPIFYALDVDPRGLSAAQVDAVGRFLRDAAAADGGGHNVGLYAAHRAIHQWVGTPYCRWGWQTYAWSAGRISPKAHLRQYDNGRSLCGGIVDLNEAYAADFGQWPRPTHRPPDTEEDDMKPHAIKLAQTDPQRYAYVFPYDGTVIDRDYEGQPLVAGAGSIGAFVAVYEGAEALAVQVDRVQAAVKRVRNA